MRTRSFRTLAALGSLVLAGAVQAGDDWDWSVTPYAWATDVGVDVSIDDRTVVDEEIEVADLMEDLDWTAQVHVEAQRRAHGILFDIFDVELSSEDRFAVAGAPSDAVLESEIGMTIMDLGGIYDPRGDHQGWNLLYGARVIEQREELDAWFEYDPTRTASYEGRDTLVDGLFGVRYVKHWTKRLTSVSRADISTGGTDLTWSAGSALDYALGKTGRYSVSLGYRRMAMDFEDEDGIDTDMTLSGVFTGLRISF